MSELISDVERTRIDTERSFLDTLDSVHEISADSIDNTHVFTRLARRRSCSLG